MSGIWGPRDWSWTVRGKCHQVHHPNSIIFSHFQAAFPPVNPSFEPPRPPNAHDSPPSRGISADSAVVRVSEGSLIGERRIGVICSPRREQVRVRGPLRGSHRSILSCLLALSSN